MPANRIATSRIGSQVKPLASRCSFGVSTSDSDGNAAPARRRARDSAARPWSRRRRNRCPGRHVADARMAATISRDQQEIDAAAHPNLRRSPRLADGRHQPVSAVVPEIDHDEDREHHVRRRVQSPTTGAASSRRNRPRAEIRRTAAGRRAAISAPPILATRKMKNTITWTLLSRSAFARMSGRTRIMAAPVVPTTLAIMVPNARIAVFDEGRAAQIAGDQNAASDHVEREQQHDEAQILRQHRMHEGGECGRAAVEGSEWRERQRRPRRRRACRNGGARAAGTAADRSRS